MPKVSKDSATQGGEFGPVTDRNDEVEGYTAAEPGWLQRIFEEGIRPVSESGVLGNVRGANREVGDALFAALANELAGHFTRELGL